MPFDRDGTLRKAEKLLRQGKLDLAIAGYRAVLEDQPSDWNTANTLGDLYIRSGQTDQAVAEYARIADQLASEGFFPKAIAVYKKILKIRPDEEHARWQLGAICARQGLMVDARANFLSLAESRRLRGDRRGEAEARVQLGDLDGADIETRLSAARARVELGDAKAAVARLKAVAADLQEKGKDADALRLLTEAAEIDPGETDVRRLLVQAYMARGEFDAASQFATSAAELQAVADELFLQGRDAEGINVLRGAADADPADAGIRAQLAKLLVTRGDIQGARALVTPEVAGSDSRLLWILAETELRAGHISDGTEVLQQMLAADPSRRDALVMLGCSIAEVNPEAGYECVDVAARAAVAADEWASAATALSEFVSRIPNHIPALMRLLEICVDGGLEATMYTAQAQLADAYLAVGAGLEARVIAEDLVAREPWERANIERFRRALALLGEVDIDATIAARLSGQSPFTSTDLGWPADSVGTELPPTSMPTSPEVVPAKAATASRVKGEAHEVDLTDVLHEADEGAHDPDDPASLERVLKGMREEALRQESPELGEQHLALAGAYDQIGMKEEARQALEVAARSHQHRFRASSLLAQAYLDGGDPIHAIEWYERAAEAAAPSPEAYHALLYDLAAVLDTQGERARALAVLLELQAEAGEYRDATTRLEQLKMQLGG